MPQRGVFSREVWLGVRLFCYHSREKFTPEKVRQQENVKAGFNKFDDAQKEVALIQARQQKEMENVRKELEQLGESQPKVIQGLHKA